MIVNSIHKPPKTKDITHYTTKEGGYWQNAPVPKNTTIHALKTKQYEWDIINGKRPI